MNVYRNMTANHDLPAIRRRRAVLLISVLVCLSVVMALFGVWLRTVSLERRQLQSQQDGMQAEYLARSGMARAEAQLAAEPNYAGETWRIDQESLGARCGATVAIHVEAVPDEPQARRVRVEADFPPQGTARTRRSRENTIVLPTAGVTPQSGEAS